MKKILLLLPKGFELLEAAAFTDVVGWTHDVFKYDVRALTCGIDSLVGASFNTWDSDCCDKDIDLETDNGIDQLKTISENNAGMGGKVISNLMIKEVNIEDFDALAIPGGFGKYGYYEEGFSETILELIRSFDAQRKPIATVCTASLLLAKAGILKGKTATTYHLENRKFLKQLEAMGVNVSDEKIVIDGNIITSSAPKTAPFVCLELLKMLFDDIDVSKISEAMGY